MQESLHHIIIDRAREALTSQHEDGSMPVGHNGPWHDIDTPVRTTAHWAQSFHFAHQHDGDEAFKDAALSALNYLLSPAARPDGDVFHCRGEAANNRSNGLIGQAWAIEALLKIGHELSLQDSIDVATEMLLMHPYNEERHGWFNLDVGNPKPKYCVTVNQQVWFATMALTSGHELLCAKARDFFEHLPATTTFIEPGLIQHRYGTPEAGLKRWRRQLKSLLPNGRSHQKSEHLKVLSQGYQSFILTGLAMAERTQKEFSLLELPGMEKWINSTLTHAVEHFARDEMTSNPYAWTYNPTGFEIAHALKVFGSMGHSGERWQPEFWIEQQLETHAMPRDSSEIPAPAPDFVIMDARVYQAITLV